MKIPQTSRLFSRSFRCLSLGNLFFLTLALLVVIAGCQGGAPEKTAIKRPVVTGVTVSAVAPAAVDDVYETTGTVRADYTSVVASRIMGRVTALYVREGQRVKAGEILLAVENEDLGQKVSGASMALESAKQNRDLAEVTWQRYRKIYEERALSQHEMDQVESQRNVARSEYERANAAVAEARTYQGFSKIWSPLAGVVTNRTITQGSMAVPGQPLMTIENPSSLYVECFADERLGSRLKKGMAADVDLGERQRFRGTIRDIVPAVDPRSRTFLVKIGLPAGDGADTALRSGLFARVGIPVGKREALLVPEAALVQKGQLTGLFTVSPDGVVTYRLVKAGRTDSQRRVEILSGLAARERIVSEGVRNAVDGGIVQRSSIP